MGRFAFGVGLCLCIDFGDAGLGLPFQRGKHRIPRRRNVFARRPSTSGNTFRMNGNQVFAYCGVVLCGPERFGQGFGGLFYRLVAVFFGLAAPPELDRKSVV